MGILRYKDAGYDITHNGGRELREGYAKVACVGMNLGAGRTSACARAWFT